MSLMWFLVNARLELSSCELVNFFTRTSKSLMRLTVLIWKVSAWSSFLFSMKNMFICQRQKLLLAIKFNKEKAVGLRTISEIEIPLILLLEVKSKLHIKMDNLLRIYNISVLLLTIIKLYTPIEQLIPPYMMTLAVFRSFFCEYISKEILNNVILTFCFWTSQFQIVFNFVLTFWPISFL